MDKEGRHTAGWKFEPQDSYVELARLQKRDLLPHEGFSRDNNGDWIIIDSDGVRVATASFRGSAKRGSAWSAPDPEGQAHGELIAAAPEMADLLREYREQHNLCNADDESDRCHCTTCADVEKLLAKIGETP